MTAFHRFLISNRVYCERCSALTQATHVIKDYRGRDTVVCRDHAGLPQESGRVGEAEKDWFRPKSRRAAATPIDQTHGKDR